MTELKLLEAACYGDTESLTSLLDLGTNPNAVHNVNGWSALHWAASRNNVEGVMLLLSRGADPEVRNSSSRIPADLSSNPDILKALKSECTRPPSPGEISRTFIPNYLKNPPTGYKVNLEEIDNVSSTEPYKSKRRCSDLSSDNVMRILKVKLENDEDFIEIDIFPKALTSFEDFLEILRRELEIPYSSLYVKKLPNTRIRRLEEVQRFIDYQEILVRKN